MVEELRIDKWLWCVRLFKTRTQATDACKAGKVKINGNNIKPGRDLKVGEVIDVTIGQLHKKVEVVGFPSCRQPAKTVTDFMKDLTLEQEYERIDFMRKFNYERRERGTGRPTKKERREIDLLKSDD